MHAVVVVLILLALTCLSSLVCRIVPVPLPLVQIAVGVIAALPPFRLHVAFEPHVFLLLFIPPLLFADGWRLPRRELRELRWPLLNNAVLLVFATVLAGGYGLHWLIPTMPLSVGFAVAAVVSPTDAVALSAITEGFALPSRMRHLLESEALLNDASGLVALRFAVAATLTGGFSAVQAGGSFLLIACGGLAVGALLTLAYAWLIRRIAPPDTDAPVQAILSALLPFAAYWLAEQAHVSGILAAVAAGIAANRAGLMRRAHWSTRMQSGSMWELIGYAFNGIIFVLLGAQLPGIAGPTPGGVDLTGAASPWPVLGQIVALTALVIAIRLIWTGLSAWLEWVLRLRKTPADWRVVLAGSLAGVRGAITLAGVLTLPLTLNDGTPFPERDLAITLATGVILLSLLIASVCLRPILRWVGAADATADERRNARIAALRAAVAAIEAASGADQSAREALLRSYRRRLEIAETGGPDGAAGWRDLHAIALRAEREAVQHLLADNSINDETAREVTRELDLFEASLPKGLHAHRSST